MDKQDREYQEKMKSNVEQLSEKAEEKAKKEAIKKIITIIGVKGILIIILIILISSLLGVVFFAGALEIKDLTTKTKATSAKNQAIGNDALDKGLLQLDNGKYKISYDGKTGIEAIESILEDNDMNFDDFTEEEIECLYKCLKAEWATTYPNLGGKVDNKDIDSEYVQGVITIKRGKNDGNTVDLKYKPYEEFKNIKDSTALDYFSMKDGNIVVAAWSSSEIRYEPSNSMPDSIKSQYVNTGEQISISETSINYRSMIGIHSVPFELLLSLLINTEDVDFVNELADVAFDSKIEITVYDNTIETITVETENTKEVTTYEKWIDYIRDTVEWEVLENGQRIIAQMDVLREKFSNKKIDSAEKTELDYNVTTIRINKSNSYVVGLTDVDSWIAKIKNTYSYAETLGDENPLGLGDTNSEKVELEKEEVERPRDDADAQAYIAGLPRESSKYRRGTKEYINEYTYWIEKIIRKGTMTREQKLTKNTTQTNEYKYENSGKTTENIGKKFKKVYDNNPNAQAQLDCVASWLFELLEKTESTVDYVSVMKYLLYVCTGEDLGVTKLDLSIYDRSEFTTIGSGIYDGKTPLDAFLLAWEGTRKDENGNFVLHRPTDVTIGYGLYLKYNLELFQNLGYFKGIDQSVWENELYQNRKQRVINGTDIKFYDYSIENGSLKKGTQIPNEKIEEACENSRANMRNSIINEMKNKNITLKDNQIDALAIVKYKWGNIGNFSTVYHYYKEGNKDQFLNQFYVSGVHPMKKEYTLSERQYAAWLIFDKGEYIDRNGNKIDLGDSDSTSLRNSYRILVAD